MDLSHKQKLFIEEYIIDTNATQAAIRAGYSKKTARSQGQRLLTNVDISKAIEERMEEKKEKLIMKQDEILIRLTEQARRQAIDYQVVMSDKIVFDAEGKPVGEERVPEVVETPTQNKDAIKAMELLGKRYKMWTDKQQLEQHSQVIIIDDVPDEDD